MHFWGQFSLPQTVSDLRNLTVVQEAVESYVMKTEHKRTGMRGVFVLVPLRAVLSDTSSEQTPSGCPLQCVLRI